MALDCQKAKEQKAVKASFSFHGKPTIDKLCFFGIPPHCKTLRGINDCN